MENTTTPPTDTPSQTPSAAPQPPKQVLVIDVGGTKLKVLATGQTEPRKVASGKRMTPARMIDAVKALTEDWEYQAVSISGLGRGSWAALRAGESWVWLGRLRLCGSVWHAGENQQRRRDASHGQL
jgi:hypothetical protein